GSEITLATLRSEFGAAAAGTLRRQLASLDQARIRHPGRHLHPSRLHSDVLSATERNGADHRLAGRLLLSVPWLEIRRRRPRVLRCARSLQPAGAALSLRERHDHQGRREPARLQFRFCLDPPALKRPALCGTSGTARPPKTLSARFAPC